MFLAGYLQWFSLGIFFRMELVPGYEWPIPIDPLIFLQTEAAALAASLGLLAAPFVKAPGPVARALLMTSLALGALAIVARMVSGLFVGQLWGPLACEEPCGDWAWRFIIYVEIYLLFGTLLYLSSTLFLRLRGAGQKQTAH
ncbi:MAG: hypothetical protein ACREJ0_23200 [Geminicoccaceae bacterium]